MVIATIGEEPLGTSSRTSGLAGDWADAVDQRQQLGDVVAVSAGQADRKRNAVRVGDQMVL
jgi:hypothetical protein